MKRQRISFQTKSGHPGNAGQKYCRMHSAIFSIPFIIKIFVLSIFEWPFKIGFTVWTKMETPTKI